MRAAAGAAGDARRPPREGGPDLDRRVRHGSDPRIDYAIEKMPGIEAFLRQGVDEADEADLTDARLVELMADRAA